VRWVLRLAYDRTTPQRLPLLWRIGMTRPPRRRIRGRPARRDRAP
jgi:hypothetical protein